MEEIVLEMDIVSLIWTTSTLNRIQALLLKSRSRGSFEPSKIEWMRYQVFMGHPDVSLEMGQR